MLAIFEGNHRQELDDLNSLEDLLKKRNSDYQDKRREVKIRNAVMGKDRWPLKSGAKTVRKTQF